MARTDITAINARTISINGAPIAGSAASTGPFTTFDQLDADTVLYLNGALIQGVAQPGQQVTQYDHVNVLSGMSVADTVRYGIASTPATEAATGPISGFGSVTIPGGGGGPTPPTPTLGTLTLSGSIVLGTASSGTISGASAGSTITSGVTGLSVNSSARTYAYDGSGSAGTTTAGLVETLAGATGSPKSSAITVATALVTVPAPVLDWRAPLTAITDETGASDTALLAQQASASTKTRGASFALAASAVKSRTFRIPASTTDHIISWIGMISGSTNTAAKVETSADGATGWTDKGWTGAIPVRGAAFTADGRRMHYVQPAAGSDVYVRVTFTGGSSGTNIAMLVHKKPASGKWDAHAVLGASREYFIAQDIAPLESAIISAFPTRDPLIFNYGQSGNLLSQIASNMPEFVASYTGVTCYTYCGSMIGGDIALDRPYANASAGTKAGYNTNTDAILNALATAGQIVGFGATSYRNYLLSGSKPATPPTSQSGGSIEFNDNQVFSKIQALAGYLWDSDLGRPRSDEYLFQLDNYDLLADEVHPSSIGTTALRGFYAATWFTFVYTGAWPNSQALQRVTRLEGNALQDSYDRAGYMLAGLTTTPSALKTSYQNRVTAMLPHVKLKTANAAVIQYQTTASSTDKTAAQTAVQAAIDAGAQATGQDSGAYGTLDGTNTLTSRINAVSSVTITKRIKTRWGKAATTGYNAITSTSTTVLANLIQTDGSATTIGLGAQGWNSLSPSNGSGVAIGTSPNDFTVADMQGYLQASGGTGHMWYVGLDTAKKYRVYQASGGVKSSSTDRTMIWTATHAGGDVAVPAAKTPDATTSVLFGPDENLTNLTPIAAGVGTITTDGTATVTVTAMTSGMFAPGQPISGTNIPAGTTIASMGTSVGGTGTLVLSAATTASGSGITATATGAVIRLRANRSGANTSGGVIVSATELEEYTS